MKYRLFTLAAAAAFAAGGAFAHGDGGKGKASHTPVVKEQKPWGIAGDTRGARTIEVGMTDNMRFTPARIEVRQGETIRFVVRNKGKTLHEMVLGTKASLDEHAGMMVKFPGMEHEEPYMTHVKAARTGEIVWNFNRAGEFRFACLIPGHYEAGMVGTIVVAPVDQSAQRKFRP